MALLGAQLVITLIMISIIQKLGPHYSLARWLLCSTGLIRYLYPTDNELRQLANIPKEKSKTKKSNKLQSNGKNNVETFHFPRSLDVKLETAKVTNLDIIHLRFYLEYQWLVDFSIYAAIVYTATEVYQMWFPLKDEVNLSMIWCFLVILFALKLLFGLTIQYFQGEESVGERSTCIVMGFLYLVISMIVLIIDENVLEIGLENAYNSFNESASAFLAKQELSSVGPASKIVLKFFIAVWCGILGALFTFPGLRIARMHWDLLKLAESSFDSLRVIAIVATMCLKIILMPWYLQAYLDMAYHRVEDQKKEAGRITNIEFQKKIAAVFYYLCAVTLQYVAPIIICIYLSLMYKTLGGYTWSGSINDANLDECPMNSENNQPSIDPFQTSDDAGTITKTAADFHLTLENLKMVFTTSVYRGLFGFSTWWCCFVYFAATSVGLIYQSYFSTV
ncbi:transmembrane protein 161B isoform X2 [Anoplophora glabripennis]|uniref:transmembrane protein 161B isoform X2 n=1 Tax=Anoplophora glabripennis TaxID=217634 RepID=UPI000874F6C1|nr:transmembrane protein 161B isoform X2 [Anoplophora glabripennis]